MFQVQSPNQVEYHLLVEQNRRLRRRQTKTQGLWPLKSTGPSKYIEPYIKMAPSSVSGCIYQQVRSPHNPQKNQTQLGVKLVQRICPCSEDQKQESQFLTLQSRNRYLQAKVLQLKKQLEDNIKKTNPNQGRQQAVSKCPDCYRDRYYSLLRVTGFQ